jgi:hypothetical protein
MHDTPNHMRKLLFRPNSLSFCDFLNYRSLDKDTVVRKGIRAMPIATVIDGRSRYEIRIIDTGQKPFIVGTCA